MKRMINIILMFFLVFPSLEACELEWKDYYKACRGKSYLRLKLFPHKICTLEIKKTFDAMLSKYPNMGHYMNFYQHKVLDLSYKGIKDLRPLSGLNEILFLSLVYNHVEDVRALASLRQIYAVDLFHNKVRNIDALSNHPTLAELTVSRNNIRDISSFQMNSALRHFIIEDNPISAIDIGSDRIEPVLISADGTFISHENKTRLELENKAVFFRRFRP